MKWQEVMIGGLSLVIAVAVYVFGTAYVQTKKQEQMSNDIRMAAEKGIDPMAIRCAYAESSDTICLIYTSHKRNPSIEVSK